MIAMKEKPILKPVVNPLANQWLTHKQYNTKQKGWVFGSLDPTQKPTTLLVELTNKQDYLSWFFFLCASKFWRSFADRFMTFNMFSTKLSTFAILHGISEV